MIYSIEIKFKGSRRKQKLTTKEDELVSKASHTVYRIQYALENYQFIHIHTNNGSFSYSCDTIKEVKFKEQ